MEELKAKKEEKLQQWLIFGLLVGLAILCMYGGVWLGTIVLGGYAIKNFPDRKIGMNILKFSFYGIVCIGVFWLISSFFSGLGGVGKYEGQSAEEWFNAYDEENARAEELQTKVDEYQTALEEANSNIEDGNSQISDVQDAEDVYELRDAIDSLSTIDTVSEPY